MAHSGELAALVIPIVIQIYALLVNIYSSRIGIELLQGIAYMLRLPLESAAGITLYLSQVYHPDTGFPE